MVEIIIDVKLSRHTKLKFVAQKGKHYFLRCYKMKKCVDAMDACLIIIIYISIHENTQYIVQIGTFKTLEERIYLHI